MCPTGIVLTDSPYDSATDTLAEKRVQKYEKSQKWCSFRMKKICKTGSNAKCLKGTLKFGLIVAEKHEPVAYVGDARQARRNGCPPCLPRCWQRIGLTESVKRILFAWFLIPQVSILSRHQETPPHQHLCIQRCRISV